MRNHLLAGIAACAAIAALSVPAEAGIFIGLQESGVNGGAITTVASDTSFVSYSGGYGTYAINAVTGATRPSSINPLDTTALNISSKTPGELNIYVSATDVLFTGLTNVLSSLTSNLLPPGWSADFSVAWDIGNAAYAMTQTLASHHFSSIGTALQTASLGAATPISLTALYDIKSTGLGTALSTIHVEQVPEPGTIALLGAALLLFVWGGFATGVIKRV